MAGEIQRKPRSGGIAKFVKKWSNKLIAYSLPALRYGSVIVVDLQIFLTVQVYHDILSL